AVSAHKEILDSKGIQEVGVNGNFLILQQHREDRVFPEVFQAVRKKDSNNFLSIHRYAFYLPWGDDAAESASILGQTILALACSDKLVNKPADPEIAPGSVFGTSIGRRRLTVPKARIRALIESGCYSSATRMLDDGDDIKGFCVSPQEVKTVIEKMSDMHDRYAPKTIQAIGCMPTQVGAQDYEAMFPDDPIGTLLKNHLAVAKEKVAAHLDELSWQLLCAVLLEASQRKAGLSTIDSALGNALRNNQLTYDHSASNEETPSLKRFFASPEIHKRHKILVKRLNEARGDLYDIPLCVYIKQCITKIVTRCREMLSIFNMTLHNDLPTAFDSASSSLENYPTLEFSEAYGQACESVTCKDLCDAIINGVSAHAARGNISPESMAHAVADTIRASLDAKIEGMYVGTIKDTFVEEVQQRYDRLGRTEDLATFVRQVVEEQMSPIVGIPTMRQDKSIIQYILFTHKMQRNVLEKAFPETSNLEVLDDSIDNEPWMLVLTTNQIGM
ncbi:MAG: hypothetical protein RR893_07060, partial [Clostridia bacterium]